MFSLRLTLIELLLLVAIIAVSVAFPIPGGRSAGSGIFDLQVTLHDEPKGEIKVRWGLIRHELFERAVKADDVVRWCSELPQLDGPDSFGIIYDVYGRQTWTGGWKYKTVYFRDTILVEYTLPDGSRRYCGIPINRRQGQQHVAISVPVDPPEEDALIAPASLEA